MTLILFDVDGTLAATSACDLKCFAAAFEKVFGAPLPSYDWHTYTHVTDSGIIQEVLESRRGSPHTPEELALFESTFAAALEEEFRDHPAAFSEVPGALALFHDLQRRGFPVALASGGMRRTALYKLSCIGFDGAAVPGAFANDSITREGIARRAIERAGGADDVVYVGDGRWDVQTSAAVGMRFIGITLESSADRLRDAGATVCLEDFRDTDAFYTALDTAQVPSSPASFRH